MISCDMLIIDIINIMEITSLNLGTMLKESTTLYVDTVCIMIINLLVYYYELQQTDIVASVTYRKINMISVS